MIIKHLHLAEKDLLIFLGSLELQIMIAAWHGCRTMASMHRYIRKHNSTSAVSYSSVVTVVDRLATKKLLVRSVVDKQIIYSPTFHSIDDFTTIAIADTLLALHLAFPDQLLHVLDTIAFSMPVKD